MDTQSYAGRYTQAQVTSVDQKQLLLLVFDGGLKFLGLAREALAAGDLVGFGTNLSRAQAIISELLSTLDHTAGGAIAADLTRLYEFMLLHLTDANAKRSVRHVDEVRRVFAIIAGAYREVLAPSAKRTASAAA
jgi:flagellar protein FliS